MEEVEKYVKEKLGKLPIHQLSQELGLTELLSDFDCTSLYPCARWDKNSINAKIETVYSFTTDMKDELADNFKNQIF